ncbi:phosphoinositide 5-phosphatase [Theileria orientalis]|uniref:Phosphoinositide 5-phosphatase n=1 Tax=Theileria orientalis TaxID=68886 RepID=A0A976M3X8_THEOR|nr:phosphoinositide 5-phosphatase [Theileria orientalis]
MNMVLLFWCKILSLVLLCRPYAVACDHSGSTKKSKFEDADTQPLCLANRNNSNNAGGESKIIYPDKIESDGRTSKSYRPPKRRYRGATSRRITDYRYVNTPKMRVQGDDEIPLPSRRRERRGRGRPISNPNHARMEYLSRKVLMLLDLNNTQKPYGYDVSFDRNKITCRAIHPYLFGVVKRGNITLWKTKTGDYPYKVVCTTVGGTENCKVYFPDYENDYPSSKPTRVDVYRRVGNANLGPEKAAAHLYFNTHDHMSPETYGQRGPVLNPQHTPTGETNATPHTSLDAQPDGTNLPPDETVAGQETAAGDQPDQIIDSAQPQEGQQASEDVTKVNQGVDLNPGVAGATPDSVLGSMAGAIPRQNPSETERVSHVEVMSDYFNQAFHPISDHGFQPVHGYDMPHRSRRRRRRSSRRDFDHDMSYPSSHHHHGSFHTDYDHDNSYHIASHYETYYPSNREFRDYPTAAYPEPHEPTILVPKRTDFNSQINPRDVVVDTSQDRQGAFDISVDRKKPQNLVLTFATKSNVYVFDGSHHSFALNQSNAETGTNDQASGTNPYQHIVFNGQDPTRLNLDAGSVRISCPTQVIDGVPMPRGAQPAQSNAQVTSNVSRPAAQTTQIPASVQNLRSTGPGSANVNTTANTSPPSSQRTNQQAANQQPPNQQAPRPQPASQPAANHPPANQPAPNQPPVNQSPNQQPATQQETRPQAANEQEHRPQASSQQEPRPQAATQQEPTPKVVPQQAPRPQPASQPAVKPQPASQPAVKPQPASQPAVKPQPASQPAVKPQPASQPAVKPKPAQQPQPGAGKPSGSAQAHASDDHGSDLDLVFEE